MKKLFAFIALIAYAMAEDCQACKEGCYKIQGLQRVECLKKCNFVCSL